MIARPTHGSTPGGRHTSSTADARGTHTPARAHRSTHRQGTGGTRARLRATNTRARASADTPIANTVGGMRMRVQ
eukprot:4047540-Pleurochrysis_carterae.AAC.1